MPETILLNVTAEVAGGPTLKQSRTLSVDAYDKLSVVVTAGASGLEIDIAPGGTGAVQLLLIAADAYGEDLRYTVNADTTERVLDQPHVLTGAGAVALLDPAATKLTFENGMASDALVQILIGRDATP